MNLARDRKIARAFFDIEREQEACGITSAAASSTDNELWEAKQPIGAKFNLSMSGWLHFLR